MAEGMNSRSVGFQFSPTYLSTNLLSPLRSPYRETVPMTNIIFGGTCSNRVREDWGAYAGDYGGIGQHTVCKYVPMPPKKLDFPRSHRHYISGLSKVIHSVVQPHSITTLLRSNCRQNDQFIDPPVSMKEIGKMKEDSDFVQEPSYSSHICRTAMFPLSTLEEYEVFQMNESTLSPRPPLCENTSREVSKVIRNRYKLTSYEKDYESPHKTGYNKTEKPEQIEKVNSEPPLTQPCRIPKTLKALAKKVLGLGSWPCWPAGNRYIISTVTGQIVEKRDILSLDDLRDFRLLRKKCLESEELEEKKTNKISQERNETEFDEDLARNDNVEELTEKVSETDPAENLVKKNLVEDKHNELQTRYLRTAKKWNRDYEKSPAPLYTLPKLPAYTRKQEINNRGMTAAMLEANRAEETLYLLLKSLTNGAEEERSNRMAPPGIHAHLYDMERREHPVLLPPDPLYKTLSYSGDRIADRLGVRYKTVAMKRYHGIHPETVPDLRDLRPPVRKCKWLGYHTSMFR
ncbi:uncharacterized protein LOC120330821 [Styela clava]|uniref:uncharacterized protein LOC120330821 n=1 Tax=Styela clava TaxID=7725 RepID=UPI0019393FAE|nr:uncharacterized protein LOC120330821 [Styela clava]